MLVRNTTLYEEKLHYNMKVQFNMQNHSKCQRTSHWHLLPHPLNQSDSSQILVDDRMSTSRPEIRNAFHI